MAMEYLQRDDLVQVKPTAITRKEKKTELPPAIAPESVTMSYQQPDQTQAFLGQMMGDAPICSTCGHITIRSGSCYKCLNCGTSMGCS